MSYFSFNPFGTKSVILGFDCDKCGAPVRSDEIVVPTPNYAAEKSSDSQVEEEGSAVCKQCNKEFEVSIFVTYSDGCGDVSNLPDDHPITVDEQYEGEDYDELCWQIRSTEQLIIFKKHMDSVGQLLEIKLDQTIQFSLLVMLYAHIVAATEQFLSSIFIKEVTNSDELTKKLIETDPTLGDRKISLKEIYIEKEKIKTTVALYLKDLIFHKLNIVKPMYKSVLNVDFGDISWLFRAVLKRHDCVHRAGFDKEGKQISVTSEEITDLMDKCSKLAKDIDNCLISRSGKTPVEEADNAETRDVFAKLFEGVEGLQFDCAKINP